MAAFQFYFQSGKEGKVGWGDSNVVFVQKFPGEKESETVRRSEATASSFVAKVRGEVFAHFQAVTVKRLQWYVALPVWPSRPNYL
jgi:hypothetical protein